MEKVKVAMIPKAGKDLTFPQSWRPISLINTMNKITERIILDRLNEHIEESHLIPDHQFGFRKTLKIELQLAKLTEDITNHVKRGKYTGVIALDIEKAFDKVWREGLIVKLHQDLHIPAPLTKLINSFLKNRKFKVKIGEEISEI